MGRSRQILREGFTTGTAASGAAKAAVLLLGGLPLPSTVTVALPPFVVRGDTLTSETKRRLNLTVADGGSEPDGTTWAAIIKDGGDDPDATHGARVIVRAAKTPFPGPSPAIQMDNAKTPIFLYAGQGLGRVTLPGLPVEVGEAAINPEPRKQIAFAAHEAAKNNGLLAPLHLEISIADGAERARRTLNARLGIIGGLSILGTSGIVRPYSHEAWQCAVSQGLAVAAALGCEEILLCTGRRSERLGRVLLPHLPEQAFVQAADFAAHALKQAAGHSFSRLNWLCFPGKLLKLAQGLEWTHARSAPVDLALLARLCQEAGGSADLAARMADMPTVTGALNLVPGNSALRQTLLLRLARLAFGVLRAWLDEAGGKRCELALHVFSLEEQHLLTVRSTV
ncbi:cobalt-precorrin-5B (C(1))-methyltransferase CbiD [Desulfovibrio sp. OttesenSCG-928-M16]|nr:cobalt-precorrin-5B (C(1))-methyltransferase CbiD [Desulfovibrio sp. OttesenSCG-928-M16]